jgi:hypothetical protein
VREAGLTPWSASGTAERQGWVADLAEDGVFGWREGEGFARSQDWRVEADRMLGASVGGSNTNPGEPAASGPIRP